MCVRLILLPLIRLESGKKPKRFDDGKSDGDFHADPKAIYRQGYYEVIHSIIAAIQERFDQPMQIQKKYQQLEALLIKAMKQEKLEDDLNCICSLYGDDFNNGLLEAQLITFGLHFQQNELLKNDMSSFDVKDYFTSLSLRVNKACCLKLTNARSERSFSALRQVKTYLRTKMPQKQLNHPLILTCNVHKERTGTLDLKDTLNSFVKGSQHRAGLFSLF